MQCNAMAWDRMDLDGMGWDGAFILLRLLYANGVLLFL